MADQRSRTPGKGSGSLAARLAADRRGAASGVFALMLVPIIAALGLAMEASSWLMLQRAAQNTADAAAMAAAANGCAADEPCATVRLSATFAQEASAVAAQMGFAADAATTVETTRVTCADGGAAPCYRVRIAHRVPLLLVRVVGFQGDTTYLGGPAQTIAAVAVARASASNGFCLMGLSGGGDALRVNGGGLVDLSGCDLWSNSGLVCNGQNADAGVANGFAVGASTCGTNRVSGVAPRADPFAALSSSPPIPTDTCPSYPGAILNTASPWVGGVFRGCGDTRLESDVVVTQPNSILAIYNGHLDLNGHTLSTTGAGSLTIVLTGPKDPPPGPPPQHVVTNGKGFGTVDIAAPTTGALRGIAVLQDGRLTGPRHRLDMTYEGRDPTLKLQGLIYMPLGNLTIRGAINLHTDGLRCVGVVANSVLVDGAGAVFAQPTKDCAAAGLVLPTAPGLATRQALVQ